MNDIHFLSIIRNTGTDWERLNTHNTKENNFYSLTAEHSRKTPLTLYSFILTLFDNGPDPKNETQTYQSSLFTKSFPRYLEKV